MLLLSCLPELWHCPKGDTADHVPCIIFLVGVRKALLQDSAWNLPHYLKSLVILCLWFSWQQQQHFRVGSQWRLVA